MKKFIDIEAAIGKTLTGVALGGDALLVFGDEFTYLDIGGYEAGDEEIVAGDLANWSPANFQNNDLIRLGIITEEEIAAYYAKRKARNAAAQERADREIYERLKARFDPLAHE